jgi:hypothetical protein
MLKFERIDALSVHGPEVRYIILSKTGVMTGRIVANKSSVYLSGKFPHFLSEEDVLLFQTTLRKASKISTMLKWSMRGANDIPDEEELEKLLEEERTLTQPSSIFSVELPRQAIAETDWRPLDDEEKEKLDPFDPSLTLDDGSELHGDEDDRDPDRYLAEL